MAGFKSWFKRPRIFWIIGVGVLLVIVLGGVLGLVVTQAAPPQPFPYTHAQWVRDFSYLDPSQDARQITGGDSSLIFGGDVCLCQP